MPNSCHTPAVGFLVSSSNCSRSCQSWKHSDNMSFLYLPIYLDYKLLSVTMMFHTWNQLSILPPETRIFLRSNNWNWILTSQRLVFQPLVPHCKCRSIHLPKLLSPDEATNVTIAGTRSLKDFELWHVCWQAMNVHDKNPTLLPSLTAPLGQVNLAGPVCSPPLYKLTWFQQIFILFPTCNQTLNHKKVIGSNLQSNPTITNLHWPICKFVNRTSFPHLHNGSFQCHHPQFLLLTNIGRVAPAPTYPSS